MNNTGEKILKNRGLILFVILIIGITFIAIIAYTAAGPMGIEERFSSALGITEENGGHNHEGEGGFALEGSPVLYALVLVIFGMVCYTLYKKCW